MKKFFLFFGLVLFAFCLSSGLDVSIHASRGVMTSEHDLEFFAEVIQDNKYFSVTSRLWISERSLKDVDVTTATIRTLQPICGPVAVGVDYVVTQSSGDSLGSVSHCIVFNAGIKTEKLYLLLGYGFDATKYTDYNAIYRDTYEIDSITYKLTRTPVLSLNAGVYVYRGISFDIGIRLIDYTITEKSVGFDIYDSERIKVMFDIEKDIHTAILTAGVGVSLY